MNDRLTILYVGNLAVGTTSLQRMKAFERMEHRVTPIAADRPAPTGMDWFIRTSLRGGFNHIYDHQVDRAIVSAAGAETFDLVWIDKGVTISPRTLRQVRSMHPRIKIAGLSLDDTMRRGNHSRYLYQALPLYDAFFTTKSFGVAELTAKGCPKVVFIGNSFDDQLHRPIIVTEQERQVLGGPVGFIGTAERERAWSIAKLSRHVPVKVWGDLWDVWQRKTNGRFVVAGNSQYDERYVRIICSFDINLCFLRKCNRDLQTTRSVEIPACGAFMLAERTNEHQTLFEEGKEAEYFGSDEELIDKTRYYLQHPQEREQIAAAGRQRCLSSGYSYHDRLQYCLQRVCEP